MFHLIFAAIMTMAAVISEAGMIVERDSYNYYMCWKCLLMFESLY